MTREGLSGRGGGSWGIEGERGAGKDLNEKDTTIKEKGRSFP